MKPFFFAIFVLIVVSAATKQKPAQNTKHNLIFNELALSWGDVMPRGNGIVGNQGCKKNGKLRFSLDRADCGIFAPQRISAQQLKPGF